MTWRAVPRWKWWVVGFGAVAGLIMFTNWPTEVLMKPLTIHEDVQTADVIIVLGAGTRRRADPLPPQAHARVAAGTDLLRRNFAKGMIVAGGYSKKTRLTEARLMAQDALDTGAPTELVVQEDQSKNTWENAVNSMAIMGQNGWKTALVVTSPYHTYRSCAIFRKLGATVRCIAAPMRTAASNSVYEHIMDFRSVIREYGALVLFSFRSYI